MRCNDLLENTIAVRVYGLPVCLTMDQTGRLVFDCYISVFNGSMHGMRFNKNWALNQQSISGPVTVNGLGFYEFYKKPQNKFRLCQRKKRGTNAKSELISLSLLTMQVF